MRKGRARTPKSSAQPDEKSNESTEEGSWSPEEFSENEETSKMFMHTARLLFTFSYYADFLEVTFIHKMYVYILCHFCLMLNREQHWQESGHMIGYQLTLVGILALAGNLKIS